MEVIIQPSTEAAVSIAARIIARLFRDKPDAVLGLATGSTPLPLYQALIAMNLDSTRKYSRLLCELRSPDPRRGPTSSLASRFKTSVRNEDISVFGDGGQTRDFIHVKDMVGALSFAVETRGVTGVFNAGYGGQITINDRC